MRRIVKNDSIWDYFWTFVVLGLLSWSVGFAVNGRIGEAVYCLMLSAYIDHLTC